MSLPDRTSPPNNSATIPETGQLVVKLGKEYIEGPGKDVDLETDPEIDHPAIAVSTRNGNSEQQFGGDSSNLTVSCGKEMIEQPAGHRSDFVDQSITEPPSGVLNLSYPESIEGHVANSKVSPEAYSKEEESLLDQPIREEPLPTNKPLPAPPLEISSPQLSTVHDTSSKDLSKKEPIEASTTDLEKQDDAENHGRMGEDDSTESRSEIQGIIDQFDEQEYVSDGRDTSSPSRQTRSRMVEKPVQHPPRTSSLEPLHSMSSQPHSDDLVESPTTSGPKEIGTPKRPVKSRNDSLHKASSIRSLSYSQLGRYEVANSNGSTSPMSPKLLNKSLPPAPDPEPDLPFDFHRFLEQLRHRTADPVAKFLRSFLVEFGKKQWMVHEQVKIISDFLSFITVKMAQCEVWREVSDAEFDNAKEGMEKLVMNRLYSQTFSPAIPPPVSLPPPKGKRKAVEKPLGPGRRGQHQEDIERDEILAQKVRIYGWVQEEHLDIPAVGESGKRFLLLAQQGMLHCVDLTLVCLHACRDPQDEDLSGSTRQDNLCTKLL